jgi:hypothetical protein
MEGAKREKECRGAGSGEGRTEEIADGGGDAGVGRDLGRGLAGVVGRDLGRGRAGVNGRDRDWGRARGVGRDLVPQSTAKDSNSDVRADTIQTKPLRKHYLRRTPQFVSLSPTRDIRGHTARWQWPWRE